ncbi:putative sulfonate/nitrate transport system substrate-binding protein [Caenispirillum salinarum AK4]|uniref:Putative sulfonate/nitrate transport system substrate-binding protein n=1 Tax=Caenispirillum salinarum AK4 TaxID=1238182 RepID=K9GSI7_9PROT|nr:putative sulfonate/nitrate transport system substrate-binding protein [Caenispirillum salinarum AK4]
MTVVHAIETGRLRGIADTVTFRAWRNPDELRAGLTSGTMNVFVLPTQSAANLFNRGLDVRLVNVMTNGLLHVVSADPALTSLEALKGRSVAVPFRNDTPDIIFRRLLTARNIGEDDLDLRFAGTPLEAAQLLATGRIDAALLPEPAASASIVRGAMAGRALTRVIDIQDAWAKAMDLPPALPQAGLGVTGAFLEAHRPAVEALHQGLAQAVEAVNAAPAEAAGIVAGTVGLPAPVIRQAIPHSNLVATRAGAARPVLEPVFKALADTDPAILGGKLPDSAFYL